MQIRSLVLASLCGISLGFSSSVVAERSFAGPDDIPVFHPLCLQPLKQHEADGGAFDMDACSAALEDIPVKLTPGGYYAKRPANAAGEPQGFAVYQPVGVLDDAMELLLVHDKQGSEPLVSEIFVVGRISDISPGTRDYLTSIEEAGQRCNGGIKSAKLISEKELLVELNVNPDALMRLAGDASYSQEISDDSETAALSLIPPGKLDDRPTTCIGTVVKYYNLLDDQEGLSAVHLNRVMAGGADDPYQACFDKLVEKRFGKQAELTPEAFEAFSREFLLECSAG